ncbi:MAG: murein biosynthesis integral membrane protein MurJ [Patescibacteria group bacterium]
MRKISKVQIGALLLVLSSLGSKALGVVRDVMFARSFGVGEAEGLYSLDAYFAAFRIPDFIYSLLIFGALSAAFVPLYTQFLQGGKKDEADDFASQILNFLLVFLMMVIGLLWLTAPFFVPWLTPGFSDELLKTTTELTRIMLLAPLFFTLSSLFQGIANSHKRFFGIALAPLLYNLSIILATLFFAERYGVYGVAWGVVVGAFMHALIQVPTLIKLRFRYRAILFKKTAELREFLYLSIPRIFGLVGNQLGLFVDIFLASLLPLGSIAIVNYALNLQSLPYAVVGISVSTAVFATLAERALNKNKDKFVLTIRASTNSILFWVLPATVGLYILKEPIVDFLLQGGAFTEKDAMLTANVFGIYLFASFAQSLIPLFARSFYALHNTKIPVLISLVSVVFGAGLSVYLTQIAGWGVAGLAYSTFFSTLLQIVLLNLFLTRKLKNHFFALFDLQKLSTHLLLSAGMALIVFFLKNRFELELIQLFLPALAGGIFYLGFSKINRTIPDVREE